MNKSAFGLREIYKKLDWPSTEIRRLKNMQHPAVLSILDSIRLFIILSLLAAVMHFTMVMQFTFRADEEFLLESEEIFDSIASDLITNHLVV